VKGKGEIRPEESSIAKINTTAVNDHADSERIG